MPASNLAQLLRNVTAFVRRPSGAVFHALVGPAQEPEREFWFKPSPGFREPQLTFALMQSEREGVA